MSNSETRQSILLPETKADMLCLSVLGWIKAHELRNTLTLQRCARLLPPDRPPNLRKTFQQGFDCYDVNVASDAMKTLRLLQKIGRSCGILSRGFLTVVVCFSLVAREVLPAASQLVPQYMCGKNNNSPPPEQIPPGFPFVGSTTSKPVA